MNSKRWSFKLAPDAALPVGPFEHFEQALRCLGPISSLHQELDPHGWRRCLCIKCACDEIQRLAAEYNELRLLNDEAPRAKHIVERADAVYRGADQLVRAILDLDDYSRKAFQDFGTSSAVTDLPVYAGFFDDGFPDPPGSSDESLWVENLVALRNAAKRVSAAFKTSRGTAPNEPADKGGNTNLFKESFGSPDRSLVYAGWRIFERFRPKHARGTEHGAFHDFLKHVFEYATGLDAEDHSSLSTWMKTLAGLLRQEDEISDRLIAAEVELETLEIEPGAVSSRREDLEQQIAVARDDLNLLRSKIKEARSGKKSGKQ